MMDQPLCWCRRIFLHGWKASGAEPDLGVQVVVSQGVHRLPVQQHQPVLRLVEVLQQTHAGALPATRRSHQSGDLAGPQGERHALQTSTAGELAKAESHKPELGQPEGAAAATCRTSLSGRVGYANVTSLNSTRPVHVSGASIPSAGCLGFLSRYSKTFSAAPTPCIRPVYTDAMLWKRERT